MAWSTPGKYLSFALRVSNPSMNHEPPRTIMILHTHTHTRSGTPLIKLISITSLQI